MRFKKLKKLICGVLVMAMMISQFSGLTVFAADADMLPADNASMAADASDNENVDALGSDTAALLEESAPDALENDAEEETAPGDADLTDEQDMTAAEDLADAEDESEGLESDETDAPEVPDALDEGEDEGDDGDEADNGEISEVEDTELPETDVSEEDDDEDADKLPEDETDEKLPVEPADEDEPASDEEEDEALLEEMDEDYLMSMLDLMREMALEEEEAGISVQADAPLVTTGVYVTNYAQLGGVNVTFAAGDKEIVLTANSVGRVYGEDFVPNGITMTVHGLSADEQAAFDYTQVFSQGDGSLIPMAITVANSDGATQSATTPQGSYSMQVACQAPTVQFNGETFNVSGDTIGVINVSKRPITVVAENAYKTYGQSDPTFTWDIKEGTLVNGDTLYAAGGGAALYRNHNGNQTEQVGSYDILSNLENSNYNITFEQTGKLVINRARLVITGGFKDALGVFQQSASREYGDKDLTAAYNVDGLRNGDTIDDLIAEAGSDITVTFDVNSRSFPGDYNVTVSGLGTQLTNYDVAYNTGSLTIAKRSITITVDEFSKVYGEDDPEEFTYEVTAPNAVLANRPTWSWDGETLMRLDGDVTREAGEDAGEYEYINGFTVARNPYYDITFVADPFVITKAPLQVSAVAATRVYGEDDPSFSVEFDGLKRGETAASNSLTGTLRFTSTATKFSDVGDYTITPSGFNADGNYAITYVPATLTVVKRPITLKIENKRSTIGKPIKEFAYTISCALGDGLVNGDTLEGEILSDPETIASIGEYRLYGTFSHKNYTVTVEEGTYTVVKDSIPATVIIDDVTSVYGEPVEEFTYTILDEDGEEMSPDVIERDHLKDHLFPDADIKDVGEYVISGTFSCDAHEFTVVDGKYTVTPRPITVTIDDHETVYGEELEELTYTLSCELGDALVDDDELDGGIVSLPVAIKDVGEYELLSNLNNSNYDITVVPGKYTVTHATIAVSFAKAEKMYGTETQIPELIFSGWKYDDEELAAATAEMLRMRVASILPSIDVEVADEVAGIKGYAPDSTEQTATYEDAFVYAGETFGNYRFEMASGSLDVSRLLADETMYAVEGTKRSEGVYGSAVSFRAAEGYKLSYSDALENNDWADVLEISGDGAKDVKFFMLRMEDGAITTSVSTRLSIDTSVPAAPAPVVSNPQTGVDFLSQNMAALFALLAVASAFGVVIFKKKTANKAQ